MKLTTMQIDGLKLIKRSPDLGDRWRHVATPLRSWMPKLFPIDLVEWSHDGSQCRTTDKAEILLEYL
jgi:hypothetical protein